jgi:hypothetical protein
MTWIGRGNPESGSEEGIRNQSAFGKRFRDWDGVAKRFLGSAFGTGIAWRIAGLRISEEDTDGQGTRWYGVGTGRGKKGVGTGDLRCWNRRWAVLEPGLVWAVLEPGSVVVKFINDASIDELAFEIGTNRCHKGEVFRL